MEDKDVKKIKKVLYEMLEQLEDINVDKYDEIYDMIEDIGV